MKKLSGFLFILLCAAQISFAATGNIKKWPALQAFHDVISQTYHPGEEGNLAPARARAKELNKKAMDLSKTKVPAGFNTSGISQMVALLQKETQKMVKMVADNENDSELKQQLAVIHDIFHKIAGLCDKNDEKDAE